MVAPLGPLIVKKGEETNLNGNGYPGGRTNPAFLRGFLCAFERGREKGGTWRFWRKMLGALCRKSPRSNGVESLETNTRTNTRTRSGTLGLQEFIE